MEKVATYVDGYLVVVPKDNVEAYISMANEAAEIWLKHGALSVRECRGDDLSAEMAEQKMMQFSKIMNISADETIWFSYIEYESKEERDRINALVHADMLEYEKKNPQHAEDMPFDMKRMAFGGFVAEVRKN